MKRPLRGRNFLERTLRGGWFGRLPELSTQHNVIDFQIQHLSPAPSRLDPLSGQVSSLFSSLTSVASLRSLLVGGHLARQIPGCQRSSDRPGFPLGGVEVGGGDGSGLLVSIYLPQLPWGSICLPEQVRFVPRAPRVGSGTGLLEVVY